jgi:DNA mismatch repair protein MutL
MGNIVLLDDLTINKIAAGEVIERPASVVKEMVENSIDAGAKNIVVEIKNGGISFIKISDDGKGIASDDLEIAFERHATSKIRSADDLDTVKSMGFRGEALASIAAIANVEVVSKTENEQIGYRVVVEAGNILTKEEVGCKKGTTMIVKNLFFNTPVRYKFLKKDFTETGYIEDVITRIALVNPDISIKLINTGKTVIQTTGNGSLKDVVYSIYGKDIAQSILETSYKYEDIHITGVIGKPEISRSNRTNQIFFVNKRYIKDKALTAATEQAFKGMIPIGKFGFVILNINMDPSKVDVNVHPAKLEVRFEEENKIFQAIYHAIKDTLLKGELIENTEKSKDDEIIPQNINNNFNENKTTLFGSRRTQEKIANYTEEESNIKTNNIIEDIYNQKNIMQNKSTAGKPIDTSDVLKQLQEMKSKLQDEVKEADEKYSYENKKEDTNVKVEEKKEENIPETIEEEKIEKANFNEMYEKTFGKLPISQIEGKVEKENKINAADLIKDNISVFEQVKEVKKILYKFIGIAFNTYIIIEMDNEMYIIDQHAAHERIMYEKVKTNYYSNASKDSQMLLLPDIITLTHKEMEIAKENIYMFEKAGFNLEEFGENTIKLTGVPTVCLDLDTKELFLETLDEINSVARTAKQEKEEKFIATVACKAAVKAHMVLDKQEVESLMDKLLQLPNPFTCPHGRPTAIKMTKYDIERKFARK